MDNKKLTIGAAALTAIIVTTGFAASSFAYQGDPNVQGPNCTPERHEAMTTAFETGDYNAWAKVHEDMGRGHIMEIINEDNFDKFVKMRKLRLAGDIERADEIRAELGLGQGRQNHGNRSNHGQKGGQGMYNSNSRGQNMGGNFIDADEDGTCDNMQ